MTDSTHETLPRMRLRQKTEMAQRGKIDQFAWLGGAVLGAMLIALVLTLAASGEWWWPALLGVGVGVLASAAIPAKRKLRMTLRRARAAEERLDAIFQGATIGLLSVTVQGEICAANHQIAQMLRRSSESLVGSTMEKLFLDAFTFQSISTLDEPAECRMLRADGLHFWARLTTFAALRDKLFVAVEDISDNRALRDTLSRCSTHDSLTDLVNRREIERRLEALLVNTQQMDVRHTLCFLDIDEFKLLNDACSHAAGDKVLRMVATALSNELSPPGWVGRLGGDEFIVLFEFVPLENGLQLAAALNRVVTQMALVWGERRFPLTASIGVVEINRDSPTVAWLLRAADTACYLAKEGGRNRIRAYEETDIEIARRRGEIEWASKIRNAVAEGRLLLYAQRIEPLNAASQQEKMQFEVLVRLQDDSGEVLLPGTFLSAAEHFSMASIVDRKVLASTVEFLAQDPARLEKLELCHVNLSGQSVTSNDFRLYVLALLNTHPAVAAKLCFELTETASVDHIKANEFISDVRKLGCLIALDDFGNGLSSFAYLKHLPADIVKIDSIFVREIDTDALGLAVVGSITGVCRSLGKRVVAEGVETAEVMERLCQIGVDAAQGFYFHRPAPIESLFTPMPLPSRSGRVALSPVPRHDSGA